MHRVGRTSRGILGWPGNKLFLTRISCRRCGMPLKRNEPGVTMKNCGTRTAPGWQRRLTCVSAIVVSTLSCATLAHAGDPKYVAGSTYFNPSTMGQPLTWSLGQVNYYTDQKDLSPILPNAAANAFVANAFLQWSSVATAAITANRAGQLAED